MAEFRHIRNNLLVRNNTSKKDVAEYCQVAPAAVSQWGNGSANPNVANLIKLSDFFKVSINYLLGRSYLSADQEEIVEGMKSFSEEQMALDAVTDIETRLKSNTKGIIHAPKKANSPNRRSKAAYSTVVLYTKHTSIRMETTLLQRNYKNL